MQPKISVVVNTLNDEKTIEQAIKSVSFADEVIVCDMHSGDETVNVVKKLGAKVFFHKKEEFVEPARNFAISKAVNDWVLVLDPDEQIPESLGKRLQEIAGNMGQINYVRIPRKNIIFDHWMQYSGWWPDYNIRFFRKGKIKWMDKIHRPPEAFGQGLDLPVEEKYAIVHHNYKSISQFLERMDRYTTIEAAALVKEGYKFDWKDFFEKPLSEFLSRFFAREGYRDGLHGLVLSFLQAFSFLVVYSKLWETDKFKEQEIDFSQLEDQKNKSAQVIKYWTQKFEHSDNLFGSFLKKFKG